MAAFCFLVASAGFEVDVVLFLGTGGGGGGSGAGLITGESRKTDGDGIVMVSISSTSGARTLATAVGRELNPAPGRRSRRCWLDDVEPALFSVGGAPASA
jgi:hypothetical protein